MLGLKELGMPYAYTEIVIFALGGLLLLIPALLITWRSMNFEHLRWAESDYGGAPGGSLLGTVENAVSSVKDSIARGDE